MEHLNIHLDRYEVQGELILSDIHIIINSTDKIAIVGPNGVGKSTFLRIISGQITDYLGTIDNAGSITLGYLEQIHFLNPEKNVRDELRDAFAEIRSLENIIKTEEKKLEETGEYEGYTEAIERYKLIGGYTYENEIERVARGIGIYDLLEKTLEGVSGGERTKIALAKILLSKPDFLLLDEPTNFIDLTSVEWLEKYLLESWKGGYMIVSHDRAFLDATVTKVMEISGPVGMVVTAGDYSSSVEEKEERKLREKKLYEEQQSHIESEKALINRFRAGSRAGFAKSREKMLERIETLEKPIEQRSVSFRFELPKERAPETLIKIEEAFIGRSDPLFFVREATLGSRERIGIVGENGVGKSTLLKTILSKLPEEELPRAMMGNKLKPLEGYLDIAKGIRVAYYSQMHESLSLEKTIEENFALHGLPYSRERVGGIIYTYGFEYHDATRLVSGLSGGERSKLLFALLCQREYHLLIFDEPTNHLDYETRESLEKSLRSYEGSILCISHDRYFMNKLAEKLWIIEDGELIISYGNYEDYRYKKEHGISLDMGLFNAEGELDLVLEEKLGKAEVRRIREKYARRKK